jgi:SAM-dependent methyltransferase
VHAEALAFVAAHVPPDPGEVLDVGGREVSTGAFSPAASPRHLFGNALSYTVLDARAGPGVDIVADATRWRPEPGRAWDTVVCCEVLEHVQSWARVVDACHAALRPGGLLILTCAAPMRPPHSGVREGPPLPGEWYRGVSAATLRHALHEAGFRQVEVDVRPLPADVRAVARRPHLPTRPAPRRGFG